MTQTADMTMIEPRADRQFVVTAQVRNLMEHSLLYLKAGLPVHYTGPAGVGKSALAFHVACRLERPIVIIHGDEGYATSDLVGGEHGFQTYRLRDQYIHSVVKTEERSSRTWVDNRLTAACKHGFTLIYDEFTRSRPEANNTLLSVLEEGMLDIPSSGGNGNYVQVHPEFRAIFTSNPEEYAGVFTAQDALRDRLVTFHVGRYDAETERAILRARTGLSAEAVRPIVEVVRAYAARSKDKPCGKTLRHSLKIARVLAAQNGRAAEKDLFRTICLHVLTSESSFESAEGKESVSLLEEALKEAGYGRC